MSPAAAQLAHTDVAPLLLGEEDTDLRVDVRPGLVDFAGPLDARRRARARLDALSREAARTVRFGVTVRAGTEVLAESVLSALDGRTACLRVGTDALWILDQDTEVG